MKPFNLERALAGDPVCTRDGREVKDLTELPSLKVDRRLVGVTSDGYFFWKVDGSGSDVSSLLSDNDLFMASKTKKIWVRASRRHSGGDIKIRTTNDITDWAEGDWRWVSGPVEIEVEDD